LTAVHLPAVLSSGDLILDRRYEWARQSLAAGDLAGAIDLAEQIVERAPAYAPAWFLLGDAREQAGDAAGAAQAFEQARATDPADSQGAAVRLARLGATPPVAMPIGYIRALFDGYAPDFDDALTGGLRYRAPDMLLYAAARAGGGEAMRFADVLDLGCGTGLAGAAFRPFCERLVGVDLSRGMLAEARGKGLYDELVEAEAMTYLRAEAERGAHYDIVLAADVLIYFHELRQVPPVAAKVLKPGGVLAFTVETHDGDGVILRDTLRYAHGAAHVRGALSLGGLEPVSLESAAARTEKGAPVPGLVVVARKPS
jgi:predicted TPR repeat methyltransferase